jgi:hypothetical protein
MIINYVPSGLTGFDLGEFPEAQDFTVEFTTLQFGLGLTYRAPSLAIIMNWGWLKATDAQVRSWTIGDVPRGTLQEPYHDSDQGWNVMIWETGDHVYIAEGEGKWDEDRDSDTYTMWFKVPRAVHDQAWTGALKLLRVG